MEDEEMYCSRCGKLIEVNYSNDDEEPMCNTCYVNLLDKTQKQLNEKKWYVSEECGKDMSGRMDFCEKCRHRKDDTCTITQKDRDDEAECARVYLGEV